MQQRIRTGARTSEARERAPRQRSCSRRVAVAAAAQRSARSRRRRAARQASAQNSGARGAEQARASAALQQHAARRHPALSARSPEPRAVMTQQRRPSASRPCSCISASPLRSGAACSHALQTRENAERGTLGEALRPSHSSAAALCRPRRTQRSCERSISMPPVYRILASLDWACAGAGAVHVRDAVELNTMRSIICAAVTPAKLRGWRGVPDRPARSAMCMADVQRVCRDGGGAATRAARVLSCISAAGILRRGRKSGACAASAFSSVPQQHPRGSARAPGSPAISFGNVALVSPRQWASGLSGARLRRECTGAVQHGVMHARASSCCSCRILPQMDGDARCNSYSPPRVL
ncbi:hypothetical protein FA09DRAFT_32542 [Tilletiopsis washingtonensis]|jgi:hypothetical protein|uniref:SWIM-type domain-containing protein n=1 Tax=Tilletiopsis washingtonensis TaxID=58919 RepID=A0A316Z9F5_9BASI|nr:hypothetical protein FA09DRAFT_32542 [Tilletiopsis washingtonensis]PWN97916.1 hypothetical protein FA09DRAFT_32542 [Tilletiopsis washingtonensis]